MSLIVSPLYQDPSGDCTEIRVDVADYLRAIETAPTAAHAADVLYHATRLYEQRRISIEEISVLSAAKEKRARELEEGGAG